MPKFTVAQCEERRDRMQPWQTWPWTVRYLVVQIAQAIPGGALICLAYILHR
jgi:hypothetical protein